MRKFYARFSPFTGDYDLYIKEGLFSNGGVKVVTDIQFVTKEFELGAATGPSASLREADAQSLFDALWEAGLRPNSGESSKAHVDQLKQHLNDMKGFAERGFAVMEKLTLKGVK